MISDPVAVLVVLAGIVYLAVSLEEKFRWARSLGSALLGILMGMLLSNVGVLPGENETYRFLVGPGVSVGIVLILFSVDVRTVFSAGPKMLAAFGIAAVGTVAGAVTGGLLWSGLVGPETWKLTGQFTGTYTGGGVNFAALGEALGTQADMFTAGIAADVIITAIWLAVCLTVPVVFARRSPNNADAGLQAGLQAGSQGGAQGEGQPAPHGETSPSDTTSDSTSGSLEKTLFASRRPIKLGDIAALAALGIGTVRAAEHIGGLVPVLPEVLWLTTIAILLAQIPAVRGLAGSAVIGNYLVLLFLASNGARSVIANIVEVGPGVFYFAATTVAVHGLILFGLGRLAGLQLSTLAVASQAAIGGPASAMALASARGYADKLLPGVAVGLLGYALGNYLGYFVAQVMRGVLGA